MRRCPSSSEVRGGHPRRGHVVDLDAVHARQGRAEQHQRDAPLGQKRGLVRVPGWTLTSSTPSASRLGMSPSSARRRSSRSMQPLDQHDDPLAGEGPLDPVEDLGEVPAVDVGHDDGDPGAVRGRGRQHVAEVLGRLLHLLAGSPRRSPGARAAPARPSLSRRRPERPRRARSSPSPTSQAHATSVARAEAIRAGTPAVGHHRPGALDQQAPGAPPVVASRGVIGRYPILTSAPWSKAVATP